MSQPLSTRLGNVCAFRKGKKPSITFDEPIAGSLPYILIESFDRTRKNFTNDLSCVLCTEDDTLIVCDGARSGLTSFGHRGYVGSTIAALVPDKAKIFPGFLYHFVKSQYDFLNKSVHGAAVPHIERQLLLGLRFHLPPLAEQERIISILDEAEEMKRIRIQAKNRSADLIPALFDEMFGDTVKNEKGWEIGTLSQFCEMDRNIASKEDSDLPYLGLEDVESDTGRILQSKEKSEIIGTCFKFTKDHILYGKLRPYLNKVALPNFTGRCSTELIPLNPKDQESKQFIANLLRSKHIVNAVMSRNTGTRMPRADMDYLLRGINIYLPPIELQKEFAARVEEIHVLSVDQSAAEQKLESLFQSLLHRAFEGEL
jgi:type I restriction enzyme S subunit